MGNQTSGPPTPQLDSADDFRRLGDFFRESNYSQQGFVDRMGTSIPPYHTFRNYPRYLYRTRETDLLSTLLRIFFIGVSVPSDVVEAVIPSDIRQLLIESGLAVQDDGSWSRRHHIAPFNEKLIVSDPTPKDQGFADVVLTYNPASYRLIHFTLRKKFDDALDLGTGNGIQAMLMAMHCKSVVAADLNHRARDFTEFNTRINGIDNIESVQGSLFEPLKGRKFDLITMNPPFFVTPASRFLFSDNPLELDDFCRLLFVDAPSHLKDGATASTIPAAS